MKETSTIDALKTVTNYIHATTDDEKHALAVTINHRIAIDTVNHRLVLFETESYGMEGLTLKILTSYLRERTYTVRIGLTVSHWLTINIKLFCEFF